MKNWHAQHQESMTPGERIADAVASFLGSWTFIIAQAALMALWGVLNTLALFHAFRFDGYPFIFLNLFMSAEAAFSAPLILMSQNRQSVRDRQQADADYRTNLESETRIEELQSELSGIDEKLDEVLRRV
jgi:uncharacterized membrane protein